MPFTIRPSSLPTWADCERREAAKLFPKVIERAEFSLRKTVPTVGAAIGTATHAGIERGLRDYQESGAWSPDRITPAVREAFEAEAEGGVLWDDTTRDPVSAITQAARQAMTAVDTYAGEVEPLAFEQNLKARIDDDFVLGGTIDMIEVEGLDDWKTGTVQRGNIAQYGGYALLAKAHGYRVDWVREVYIPRKGVTKPQPEPIETVYDVAAAEEVARESIRRVKEAVTRFRETGEPSVFLPNPSSMLCGRDYCPAFGTAFCRAHKPEEVEE